MSTRGWSGMPPADADEARERLMQAAVRCLQRFGFEKTGVGDIAAEAGVTKPTIYSYFESRDELLRAALHRESWMLAERILAYARLFDDPRDQIVEAVLLCLREIPNEPGLAVSTRSDAPGFGSRNALRREGIGLARHLLEELFCDHPELLVEVDELAEIVIRWMLSLLLIEGPSPRDEQEIRSLLHRRMLPGLGLGTD